MKPEAVEFGSEVFEQTEVEEIDLNAESFERKMEVKMESGVAEGKGKNDDEDDNFENVGNSE